MKSAFSNRDFEQITNAMPEQKREETVHETDFDCRG